MHTHTFSLKFSLPHAYIHFLSNTVSYIHAHLLSQLTHISLSYKLTHSLTRIFSLKHAFSYTHSLTYTLSLLHSLSYTYLHIFSHIYTLTHILFIYIPSVLLVMGSQESLSSPLTEPALYTCHRVPDFRVLRPGFNVSFAFPCLSQFQSLHLMTDPVLFLPY